MFLAIGCGHVEIAKWAHAEFPLRSRNSERRTQCRCRVAASIPLLTDRLASERIRLGRLCSHFDSGAVLLIFPCLSLPPKADAGNL
jgi:hypothetical protein